MKTISFFFTMLLVLSLLGCNSESDKPKDKKENTVDNEVFEELLHEFPSLAFPVPLTELLIKEYQQGEPIDGDLAKEGLNPELEKVDFGDEEAYAVQYYPIGYYTMNGDEFYVLIYGTLAIPAPAYYQEVVAQTFTADGEAIDQIEIAFHRLAVPEYDELQTAQIYPDSIVISNVKKESEMTEEGPGPLQIVRDMEHVFEINDQGKFERIRSQQKKQPYRALIAFNSAQSEDERIEMAEEGDFYHFLSELGESLAGYDIIVMEAVGEGDMTRVAIKNNEGNVLDVVDISEITEENAAGYVLIESGKEPVFVSYDLPYTTIERVENYFGTEVN